MILKSEYPEPKFKVNDRVVVDGFENATIARRGLFKNGRTKQIYWNYQLKDNMLPGFWAAEDRIKLRD
jgi:hypothetical protein